LALLCTFARWNSERIGIDLWNLNDISPSQPWKLRRCDEAGRDVLGAERTMDQSLAEIIYLLIRLHHSISGKSNFQVVTCGFFWRRILS
jgi:hypothetical protein